MLNYKLAEAPQEFGPVVRQSAERPYTFGNEIKAVAGFAMAALVVFGAASSLIGVEAPGLEYAAAIGGAAVGFLFARLARRSSAKD
ncbi:MAG: hypothetical protein K0S81_2230 [Rhodospirillales bacterium]|nr:hypothetical protein [Rhodospirillales bacterium]